MPFLLPSQWRPYSLSSVVTHPGFPSPGTSGSAVLAMFRTAHGHSRISRTRQLQPFEQIGTVGRDLDDKVAAGRFAIRDTQLNRALAAWIDRLIADRLDNRRMRVLYKACTT